MYNIYMRSVHPACLLFLAAFLSAGFPAGAASNVVIAGTVLYQGSPVEGANVSLLDNSVVTGADGSFRFRDVPALHLVRYRHYRKAKDGALEFQDAWATVPLLIVAAYAEREEKSFLGLVTRIIELGAERVVPTSEAEKPLVLNLNPVGDWERYCRKCHPVSPAMVPGTVIRPAPGDAPKPSLAAEAFPTHRYRDSHPSGFIYEEAAARAPKKTAFADKVAGLPLADGKLVDCRTCHTFHQAGPVSAYVRAEFRMNNDLCRSCHR